MKKLLPKKLILTALSCYSGMMCLQAQTSSQDISANLAGDQRVNSFTMEPLRGTPSIIKLNTSGATLGVNDVPGFLSAAMGVGNETVFNKISTINTNGVQVDKYQQVTNGIKVEHGVFKATSRKGIVYGLTAEYYNLPASITSTASLSESAALQKALDHVGASLYAWEYLESLGNSPEITAAYNEVYPKGELVFVDNYLTDAVDLALAYKFNVYAAEPLSRADIYVDANSGQVLLLDAIIKHADGHGKEEIRKMVKKTGKNSRPLPVLAAQGDTRYAGTRMFDTSFENGMYVLKGTTPTGVANETRSMEGIGGLPLSVPAIYTLSEAIYDGDGDLLHPETADNNWTAGEHRKDQFSATSPYPVANEKNNDDVALDAHWGAEVVLNYWQEKHNRDSYDNLGTKVFNYVHYGDGYDNAFWNGSAMTYGDGSYQGGTNPDGAFAPLTSMDVCSHEIGHGVCEFTADLVYQRESGAMNEGFSDIWAAAVEHYVLTEIDGSLNYDPWGIGEQIDERDGGLQPGDPNAAALRWMDDPKAAGDPDSYGGANWREPECGTPTLANDYCGVHTNSGVLNKWYYLLVTGSGQSFSAGSGKAAADDQVSDGGRQYEVQGIGFDKASAITYLAETMLAPNAKFIDMRQASIFAAQVLYGIGSDEEIQVTNSWYAVDIGDSYSAGEPNTITFSDSNILIFSEENAINGCADVNTYNVLIGAVDVPEGTTINVSTAGSTATRGQDYDISGQSFTFGGTSTNTITVTVYDDAVVEQTETIVLSFVYNGQFMKQEFSIGDNDFAPRTGNSPFDLLATETFSNDGIPNGWSIQNILDGVNNWTFNGTGPAAGKAFITVLGADIPTYDQLVDANTILRTPMLNAGAASDVTVSFDWEAGGETDVVETDILFDYGEFMYSLDGVSWITVEQFVGDAAGASPASGSFNGMIPQVDGKNFFLGWRWYNDALVGTAFSMTVDNVTVTATPAGIETEKGSTSTTQVHLGQTIYFMSSSDNGLIAKIENVSEDLGCVTMSVTDEGTSFRIFDNVNTARPSKAFGINVENANATYDLTLYFTENELNAFDETVSLIPMKVNSSDMNDANSDLHNFQLNGQLTNVDVDGQFKAFTGTFKGSGAASIVQEFDYTPGEPVDPTDTTDPEDPTDPEAEFDDKHDGKHDHRDHKHKVKGDKGGYAEFTVFPNPAVTTINISTADANMVAVTVFDLMGGVPMSQQFGLGINNVELDVAQLNPGLYIMHVLADNGETFILKFFKQ